LKSLMLLWKKIADESAIWCCTSATRDYKYVTSRVEHEGFSFLTITLPTFGKDFEKSLDRSYVDRDLFKGFPWQAGSPRFLGGFLDLVFDRASGSLLENPSIDAILAIRQLTLMFNKILLECSDARKKDAIDSFLQCEQDVRIADAAISPTQWDRFKQASAMLYSSIFTILDRKIYYGDIRPKHGPGATADGLKGNKKYLQSTWPSRLDSWFPIGDHVLPNYRFIDRLDHIELLEPGSEIPSKVILVPKTLKTPRIIAAEPTAMQYAQQAILEPLVELLESEFIPSGQRPKRNLISKMIGFRDQSVNQRMALEGSHTGSLASIDLSEASDRVSNQHVRNLLVNFPHLQGAVDACRSRKADVDGKTVRLAKFAPMGSALCFPMEAMVFLAIIFVAIAEEHNEPLSQSLIKRYSDSVRVYGDDIIVPVNVVRRVVDTLESFGIRVNVAKSFWNGKFRESCGKEYYNGSDVSIVRVRRVFPTQHKQAAELISIVSLRNQLYFAGYWQTCRWLDDHIRRVIRHYPVVSPTSSALGRHSFLGYETQRIGGRYQSPLVRAFVTKSVLPRDPLDDYGALLKWFLKRSEMPIADRNHLERAGRPLDVSTNPRWVSPF